MSVKDIEVEKKTRDVYLKLSKEGPYASNGFLKSRAVTKKEIDNAIFHDEQLIEKIYSELDSSKVSELKEIYKKIEQIKEDEDWKYICDIGQKILDYEKIKKILREHDGIYVSSYKEMEEILENSFAKKYETIMDSNRYKDIYQKYMDIYHTHYEEMIGLRIIKSVEEEIENLKEYCLNHPENIIDVKKVKR